MPKWRDQQCIWGEGLCIGDYIPNLTGGRILSAPHHLLGDPHLDEVLPRRAEKFTLLQLSREHYADGQNVYPLHEKGY